MCRSALRPATRTPAGPRGTSAGVPHSPCPPHPAGEAGRQSPARNKIVHSPRPEPWGACGGSLGTVLTFPPACSHPSTPYPRPPGSRRLRTSANGIPRTLGVPLSVSSQSPSASLSLSVPLSVPLGLPHSLLWEETTLCLWSVAPSLTNFPLTLTLACV